MEFKDTAERNKSIQTQPLDEVLQHIDAALAASDQYEDDEPHPSEAVIGIAKDVVRATAGAGITRFPKTYVAAYYGELDLTWKTDRKLMRMIISPGGDLRLYRQANYRESPRGESHPISPSDGRAVADQIRWLLEP